MKAISGKKFSRILERHGWELLRIQGSHHIYGKSGQVEPQYRYMEIKSSRSVYLDIF
jgi:hypothetical protein